MIETVLERFEQDVLGKRVLFFPAPQPERLVVIFTGACRGRYSMWSWFYTPHEDWSDTAYLFLNEDTDPTRYWWYLKEKDTYEDIILYYMQRCQLNGDKVYTAGGSMGGYAALYYAITLRCAGAIGIRPQVTFEEKRMGAHLRELWVSLDTLVLAGDVHLPLIYLAYPDYAPDVAACHRLITSLIGAKTVTVIHPHGGKEHNSWDPSKYLLESILDFFQVLSGLPLQYDSTDENTIDNRHRLS